MRPQSRHRSLPENENEVAVQLQDLTEQEFQAFSDSYKHDAEHDCMGSTRCTAATMGLHREGFPRLCPDRRIDLPATLTFADPVVLSSIEKGGYEYWDQNNARMDAIVARVQQREKETYGVQSKQYTMALAKAQKSWQHLQRSNAQARMRKCFVRQYVARSCPKESTTLLIFSLRVQHEHGVTPRASEMSLLLQPRQSEFNTWMPMGLRDITPNQLLAVATYENAPERPMTIKPTELPRVNDPGSSLQRPSLEGNLRLRG